VLAYGAAPLLLPRGADMLLLVAQWCVPSPTPPPPSSQPPSTVVQPLRTGAGISGAPSSTLFLYAPGQRITAEQSTSADAAPPKTALTPTALSAAAAALAASSVVLPPRRLSLRELSVWKVAAKIYTESRTGPEADFEAREYGALSRVCRSHKRTVALLVLFAYTCIVRVRATIAAPHSRGFDRRSCNSAVERLPSASVVLDLCTLTTVEKDTACTLLERVGTLGLSHVAHVIFEGLYQQPGLAAVLGRAAKRGISVVLQFCRDWIGVGPLACGIIKYKLRAYRERDRAMVQAIVAVARVSICPIIFFSAEIVLTGCRVQGCSRGFLPITTKETGAVR